METLHAALIWDDEDKEFASIKWIRKNKLGGVDYSFGSQILKGFIEWLDEDIFKPQKV